MWFIWVGKKNRLYFVIATYFVVQVESINEVWILTYKKVWRVLVYKKYENFFSFLIDCYTNLPRIARSAMLRLLNGSAWSLMLNFLCTAWRAVAVFKPGSPSNRSVRVVVKGLVHWIKKRIHVKIPNVLFIKT
jgi:hypothetical protein